ncbi:MAG TPA: hypothetical protein VMW74_05070 [Nitrosopumilaceae archaeon]|jgi:hypothetical protein|nr:hypothetical protein [Nitrosopumilaceae archaeon]
MGYDKLCKNILELDPKIRFVGVVKTSGILTNEMNQEGVEQLLSPEELKMSIHYSKMEWEKSKNLSHKIGNESASIVEYDKVTLISIPLNNQDLFVASMEPNEDYFKMLLKIKSEIQNGIND